MSGMEALLRWRHPDLGMVPPAQFIPIAEETGLIHSIGQWVIRTACRQNKAWQARGFPPMRVAVNLSARQFNDEHLVASIAAILDETGLDPAFLEVETHRKHDHAQRRHDDAQADRARGHGRAHCHRRFRHRPFFAAYLKRFPIDTLKIDRSFVSDLTRSAEDRTITTTIITMGKSLDLTVVAEGVETAAQLEFLRAQGCDEFQGYYAHKPMPADEFAQLLQIELDQLLPFPGSARRTALSAKRPLSHQGRGRLRTEALKNPLSRAGREGGVR